MDNTPQTQKSAAQKIVDLEEKLLFQQHATDELNEVVLLQGQEIVQLRAELAALRKSVAERLDAIGSEDLPHERPPHY